jgi:hypothetical protein
MKRARVDSPDCKKKIAVASLERLRREKVGGALVV